MRWGPRANGITPPPAPGPGNRETREPSLLAWLLATVSLILPWIGVPLCLWGGVRLSHGAAYGGHLLAAGFGLILLDIVIDFGWAHSSVGRSDDPTLNVRGAELVGRILVVAEPIRDGRGKVRAGDTHWAAEGPDCAAGALVRVRAVRDVCLLVEPA